MLVLSRRVGDSITIGDDVVVTILEVRSDVVRIGVDAPRSVRVHRSELLAEIESSNKQAASPDADAVSSLSEAVRQRQEQGREPGQEPGREPEDPGTTG